MLCEPKYAHNVGMVQRLASSYGFAQVWFTGDRMQIDLRANPKKRRLPREERMRGYRDVELVQHDRPLDFFPEGVVPVAVEVRPRSEPLDRFVHPERAVYIFGPEDGSIPAPVLVKAHRFVVIPTRHCLNLATAVATVMWDRLLKAQMNGASARIRRAGP
jgi:tRNA(Leu) C34 or U34 (ribose-2'-O)-methylase TrmL